MGFDKLKEWNNFQESPNVNLFEFKEKETYKD